MANEGTYGNLAGTAAGAAIGTAILPGAGTLLGAGLGGTLGGTVGGLFGNSGPKTPDISGELSKIDALFAKLRAQNTVNINRQAALGRTAAASNLATRGIYSSPVSENTFGRLEGDRLNSIATSDAQLAGQEAEQRSGLLRALMGLDYDSQNRRAAIDANRTGQLTGLSSSLLFAMLKRGKGGAGGPMGYPMGGDPNVGAVPYTA